ncbi:MAG: YaaC family protein [Candidatus Methanoperedens sp.]|nr:YaaC family protein [Candidatus Methanoperedens sp.]
MRVKIVSEEKIHTEKPLDELWLQLRLFECEYYSRQFLKDKYNDITDEELNNLSVIFASNIKQAYEYYSAASSVSILTSPLLYYYGMMCLTNVIWATINKTKNISKKHGLGSKSDGSDHSLSNEYVTIHKNGSFPALHACFSDFPIKEGTKFYIKDILSVIPELNPLFEKIYNEKPRLIKLIRRNLSFDTLSMDRDDILHFREVLKNNDDFLKQYNLKPFINLLDEIIGISFPYSLNNILSDYPLQKNMNGEMYLTLPIKTANTSYAIPEASAHFIVMHSLGMLVRYEPIKWLQIVSGKLSSDITLINRFIDISKRKFPNIILNGLLGKDMQFIMNNDYCNPALKGIDPMIY